MITTDIARTAAILGLILAFVVYANARAERQRDERRFKLQQAARTFADALIEFGEER